MPRFDSYWLVGQLTGGGGGGGDGGDGGDGDGGGSDVMPIPEPPCSDPPGPLLRTHARVAWGGAKPEQKTAAEVSKMQALARITRTPR